MRFFLAFIFMLPLASAAADSHTRSLMALLAGIDSIEGQFQQTILDQGGQRLQEASGDMIVARGNRFRWHTREPFEQLALSDGETVWVHDPDLEQVIIKPLTEEAANTPALLFGGDPASVAEAFRIRLVDEHDSRRTWQLEPVQADALFVQLEITFNGNAPEYMRLEDALGQQTGIQFQDLTVNGALDDSMFRFEVPEGTDVIRQQE